MLKKSIRLPLIYFISRTFWNLFANKEINMVENISISIVMYLIIIFYEWSKVPYEWKKKNNE
ncbi:hypothetical protein [Halalkalibacter krulwichiae]|uniref:Uncharacterized protein n=1 Tax=Halalkalibacter krulwichiae TaxID=199441 RepID=A0A1X9MMT5_9BACI|nr:hypothetical protein [Halalkalibacter krulwichiae]ARK32562.1 hypothetical protein BkAM31D_23325 [Halalkalibacter krulwichiae]